MRRRWWLLGMAAAASLALVQTTGLGAKAALAENDELYKELELFEHALSIVRTDYVEEPKAKEAAKPEKK